MQSVPLMMPEVALVALPQRERAVAPATEARNLGAAPAKARLLHVYLGYWVVSELPHSH